MQELGASSKKLNMYLEVYPLEILNELMHIVLQQQSEFDRIWVNLQLELRKNKIFLKNEKQLNRDQKKFVIDYFEQEVRSNIIPLMVESIPEMPYIRDKSIYLGVVMRKKTSAYKQKYALIEVPSKTLGDLLSCHVQVVRPILFF